MEPILLGQNGKLNSIKKDTTDILSILNTNFSGPLKRYGFRRKKNEADPSARIEYIYDAVGMTPLTVNQSSGACNYGSWGDIWFVKNNYPCMLKADGTEDSRFTVSNGAITGDTSKLSATAGGLNAMSAIPLCWVKRYEADGYEYVIFCEHQFDDSYRAYAHTNAHGGIEDYFYHAMYKGSYTDIASGGYSATVPGCGRNVNETGWSTTKHTLADVTHVLRSLAGQIPEHNTCALYETLSAKKNSNAYDIRSWSQHNLIADLITLITKSDNSQEVIGQGISSGYVNDEAQNNGFIKTGRYSGSTVVANQFYGTNNTRTHMCAFWIEDFLAHRWDRLNGIILINGIYRIKMTPENGGYNLTGDGYIEVPGIKAPTASNSYIINSFMSELGALPIAVGGTSSTHLADALWTNLGVGPYVGLAGGACTIGSSCGSRCLSLNTLAAQSASSFGASLTKV